MMPLSIRLHMGWHGSNTHSVCLFHHPGRMWFAEHCKRLVWTLSCGEIVPYYMWVELCRRWVHDDIFFFFVFRFFQVNIYFVVLVVLGGRDLIVHIFLVRLECLRTRLGYSHQVHFTFTFLFSLCSYFSNALIQHCNFMKCLYENKMTAKNTLTRNVSLHVYYATLKQSKNQPSEASWSTWKNIHNNYIHSNEVLWALLYIWNKHHQPTMYMLRIWQ